MKRSAQILCTVALSSAMVLSSVSPALAVAQAGMGQAMAATTSGSASEQAAKTSGILVTLSADAGQAYALMAASEDGVAQSPEVQELESAGVNVTNQVSTSDGTVMLCAQPAEGMSDAEAVEAALGVAGVASAQPNYVYELIDGDAAAGSLTREMGLLAETDASGSETLASELSLIPVNDPYAQVEDASLIGNQYWAHSANLIGAWREAKADHSVTIAVMDSGASLTHEDLSQNLLTELAYDASEAAPLKDTTPEGDGAGNGHGTHVAGIAGAVANNGKGIAGASNNASILPIKVTNAAGTVSTESVVAAYNYLFNLIDSGTLTNVHVVNLSLGGNGDAYDDWALHNVIKRARNSNYTDADGMKHDYNIATVCAGGNKTTTSATQPDTYMYPSDWEECISVTALETDGTNLPNSQYNLAKDISAPGQNIYSTGKYESNPYITMSGTSMASPIVAGTIALMFSAVPDATVADVCEALYTTATPVVDQQYDRTTASGSHGAIDARAATDYLIDHKLAAAEFSDVNEGDWFKESVDYASRRHIMNGHAGSFTPSADITREQVATVLYNYLGNGEVCEPAEKADVDQSAYYAPAVNWAVAHGIIKGYGNSDRFGVGDSATREQIAGIFANMLASDEELEDQDQSLYDALPDHEDTSDWAKKSVVWALNKGIINGASFSDGSRKLLPGDDASRAVMAALMMNVIKSGVL